MSLLSTNVLCCIIFSLQSSPDEFKGRQQVQKALLLSPTANTVTTATQKHLELQENHLKFLWACQ